MSFAAPGITPAGGRRWSATKWLETRHELGRNRDRLGALAYQIEAGATPFDWQTRFIEAGVSHPALFARKLAIGGLGAGKSDLGILESGNLTILNPGPLVKGMATAPTNDLLKQEIQPRLEQWFENMARAKLPLLKKPHRTQMRYELWCGANFFLRSLERYENYRGWQLAHWWGDEIETLINPLRVWLVMSNRVRKVGYVREAFGTSTMRGDRGCVLHFRQQRAKARGMLTAHVDDAGVEYIRRKSRDREILIPRDELLASHYTIKATSKDNPTLGDDYLLSLENMSERRYREEVLAELLPPESSVWPEFTEARHVIDWPAPWVVRPNGELAPNPAFDNRHPVDLAFDTGDNYPHALFIQRMPGGLCIVVGEYCEDGGSIGKTHDAIIRRQLCCRRAPDNIVGDRAVPDELGWMMQQWPNAAPHKMVKRVEQDVLTGVEVVRDRASPIFGDPMIQFARHLTVSPPRRGIWNCVRNYRYQVSSDGSYHPRPHKDNVHDHGADALRMHQVALFGGDGKPRFYSINRKW